MKASTELLSPTRVRLTVEVPFPELASDVSAAYRRLARQVRVQGFRPGKVPPRILDQRLGRATVLDEAVREALPRLYTEAVREAAVTVVGRPEVDITAFSDGGDLVFTAMVEVRPDIVLPPYTALEVTVEDGSVAEAEVDEQIAVLRDRLATLEPVERPVETGDVVTIDLSASLGGEPLPEAEARGMSHEVGSGRLIAGLDEVLVGMSPGEERTFATELVGGEHAGETAQVSVVVRSVRVKNLPALDDDLAQSVSEFDTLEELRADLRSRLEQAHRYQQGVQARDHVLDLLVERTEVPLPEGALAAEISWRAEALTAELTAAGLSLDDYLAGQGMTSDELVAAREAEAARALRSRYILDVIAERERIAVGEAEIAQAAAQRARQAGVDLGTFAKQLMDSGGLPALVEDTRRGKALAWVLERAVVTDPSGTRIDLSQIISGPEAGPDASPNTGSDAGTDAGTDAEADAGTDAGSDEATDEATAGGTNEATAEEEPAAAGGDPSRG